MVAVKPGDPRGLVGLMSGICCCSVMPRAFCREERDGTSVAVFPFAAFGLALGSRSLGWEREGCAFLLYPPRCDGVLMLGVRDGERNGIVVRSRQWEMEET